MVDHIPDDSVGLVAPKLQHFDTPLHMQCGRTLPAYDLIYETYGQLNAAKNNAILICHALSSDHHAAGYHSKNDAKPGWWETCIGPGKAIDTRKFFVVCPNNIGSCRGSTGPMSTNPEIDRPYGPDFPVVTVKDWVQTQQQLSDFLGIEKWAAVIGGSLGGMQAMQWAIDLPQRLHHAVVIASAPRLSAQNIAFNEIARQAIMSDADFHAGHFYEHNTIPRSGLMLARMLGHITYLSEDAMREKFGRDLKQGKLSFDFDVNFQVESYLRYQGKAFVNTFDANSYLLMTKALDYFDPAQDYDDNLVTAMAEVEARFLVLSFTSDWRFSPERSREIVKALLTADKIVSYAEIAAHQGHDAFLMSIPDYLNVFHAYMDNVAQELDL